MKRVIITGGGNGIGKDIATHFKSDGYEVIVFDLTFSILSQNDYHLFTVDCSKEEEIVLAFETIQREIGSVDVLINNVGIFESKELLDCSLEDWNKILSTNLTSTFLCTREFVRHFKGDSGRIINLGSTRAQMSEANTFAYSASKGGIVALTHSLAISLQPKNITVNCISPGWIHTGEMDDLNTSDHQQHPSNRVGTPRDISSMCLYLASEESGFINGQNIVIDGGMTKKMIYIE